MAWLGNRLQHLLCGGVLWGLVFTGDAVAEEKLRRMDFNGPGMGTMFRIALFAEPHQESAAALATEKAFVELTRLNRIFSDYEPNSEINRAAAAAPQIFEASSDLVELSGRALELAAATRGAFDPTCGPLTRLWRRTRSTHQLPPPERVASALALTGWKALQVDSVAKTVQLQKAGMLLDFGGIAKGHAADRMLAVLREAGFSRALVQAGGDTVAGDPPPSDEGWLVEIRSGINDRVPVKLRLANEALSTSGDLHQFVEIGGRRFSHVIDLNTGLGMSRRMACSVRAKDAATSDALATALCVLGPEQGREVGRRLALAVRWVWLDDGLASHEAWLVPNWE